MKKLILLTSVFYLCVLTSHAQSGELDPTFGDKGIVKTDMGTLYDYSTLAKQVLIRTDSNIYILLNPGFISKRKADGSVDSSYGYNGYSTSVPFEDTYAALQPDGQIVIAGTYRDTLYAVARITANGLADKTFGTNGIQLSPLNPKSVVIQKDGTITLAGYISNANDENFFAVASFTSTGSPDSSFNGTGLQQIDFGFKIPSENGEGDSIEVQSSFANSVAIQADGKIVAGGYVFTGADNDFAVARFNKDGTLDSTFNEDGKQTTKIGSSGDIGYSLAIQSNGKIILAGYVSETDQNLFGIVRYNADGSLDKSFDDDGKQTANLGSDMLIGNSVAIQKSGKIVVAGYTQNGVDNDFAVARFNTDGSPDQTFDGDGMLTTDFTSSDEYAGSVAIQSDDKIVVAGYSYTYSTVVKEQFVVTRYNNDGSLDSSFDYDGKLVGHYNQGNTSFNAVAVQSDGKLVAAGSTTSGRNNIYAVVRYDINGNLDSSFSEDGKQTTDFGTQDDIASSVVIQNDGKIIVAGNSNSQFSVARYNTDGSRDITFNGDGKQVISMGDKDVLRSVALQSDGKIVLAGYTSQVFGDSAYFAVARLDSNGTLDPTFSEDGKLLTNFDSSSSFASSVVIQTDGKIVVGGRAVLEGRNNFAIARYNKDGSPDKSFAHDGKQNNVFGAGGYYGTSLAIQNDGKILMAGFNETIGGITSSFAVARYKSNGEIDSTFGRDGSQTISLGPNFNFGTTLAIDKNGRIVLGGTNDNFAIVVFKKDGTLDSSFGGDGIQETNIGIGESRIQGIAIADNKLYAAGYGLFPGSVGVIGRYFLVDQGPVPPTVNIISPADNATYLSGGNVYLDAAALDADGTIEKVEFYNGKRLLYTTTDSSYKFKWEHVRLGNYTLTAKATDNDGLVTTSAPVHISVVRNKVPTVNIITPANDQAFNEGVTIHMEASAIDPDGRVTRVEFYEGTNLLVIERKAPYTFDWNSPALGNYTITAKAFDNWGGSVVSAPVNISVVSNKAPSVSIISPANRKNVTAPATIQFVASAQDPDGKIAQVAFYNGTTLLTTEVTAPYIYQWVDVPAGIYNITAVAKDNQGAETVSAPIVITVTSGDQPVSRSSVNKRTDVHGLFSMQVYPNPVQNILQISTSGLQTNKQSNISVVSASGVIVKQVVTSRPDQKMRLDVSSLAAGVYIIKVISGDKVMYRQFVKL